MKKIILLLCIISTSFIWIAWGVFGHEHINRSAVFALPEPLRIFFYNHIDYITQESTVPDLRKYTLNDKAENPRHYIDIENFNMDSLPKTLAEVKAKYDEKFISSNGILPWYMEDMMEKLTKAFKEKRKTEILFLAGDLGHYMGDAHMPLHTSANHDGQMTNQKGIHSLWESRLPEMFGTAYNFKVKEAKFIDDVPKETWRIIMASHKLKDTLLSIDKELRNKIGEANMYKKDKEGKVTKSKFGQPLFSDEYATQLHGAMKGMVENQMRLAAENLSNFWYTAWVNAGKPDLSDLDPSALTKRNSKSLKQELKLWNEGKLFGIESEKEY